MLKTSEKKILLSFHIIMISIWFGSITSILLLQLCKHSISPAHFFVLDQFIFAIFDSVILVVSIAVTISGLIFSMFTPWGFFKFRWLIVKWIAIVLLAVFLIFIVSPSFNGLASTSDVYRQGFESNPDYLTFQKNVVLYSCIQLAVLVLLIFLSVIKPWGARKQRFIVNRKIIISSGLITGILLAVSITMQYQQLIHHRSLPVSDINLETLDDGNYIGKAKYGFEYIVKVHIRNHLIENIEILKNRSGFYARIAEGVKHKIIREQKINVDTVTGATTTSKILMKAVEDALVASSE